VGKSWYWDRKDKKKDSTLIGETEIEESSARSMKPFWQMVSAHTAKPLPAPAMNRKRGPQRRSLQGNISPPLADL
jgi:hypothetical protein